MQRNAKQPHKPVMVWWPSRSAEMLTSAAGELGWMEQLAQSGSDSCTQTQHNWTREEGLPGSKLPFTPLKWSSASLPHLTSAQAHLSSCRLKSSVREQQHSWCTSQQTQVKELLCSLSSLAPSHKAAYPKAAGFSPSLCLQVPTAPLFLLCYSLFLSQLLLSLLPLSLCSKNPKLALHPSCKHVFISLFLNITAPQHLSVWYNLTDEIFHVFLEPLAICLCVISLADGDAEGITSAYLSDFFPKSILTALQVKNHHDCNNAMWFLSAAN